LSSIEVVGLGALNIDHIYKVERILADGEAVANQTVSTPGGSAANTIYGLAKLGVTVGFIGVVGDDAEGKLLVQDFHKVGVDTSHITVKPETRTGSVLCLSDRQGHRSLYVTPGVNSLLTMDDLELDYINRAKMLHVSSFVADRQFKVLLELTDRLEPSVKVSFSPGALYAAKGLNSLGPILARTHLLFINRDEIRQMTGQDVIPGVETCLTQGCQIVVVTLGKGLVLELSKGARVRAVGYIRDAESEYAVESGNIARAVDTTGAGDAFAAGFVYGLLNSKGLKECGRLGDIAAQLSATKIGARPGFPAPTQLSQYYQELYPD
jgi:ribokinase